MRKQITDLLHAVCFLCSYSS